MLSVAHQNRSLGLHFLSISFIAIVSFGCHSTRPADMPQGDVQVQIPLSIGEGDHVEYQLKNVVLKKIESLRHVRGAFAQFYYTPGLKNNRLDGVSPLAFFIQTAHQLFIPKDELSTQMATMYYHFQELNLAAIDLGLNEWVSNTAQVAIQARVMDEDSQIMKNNAFFDGSSQSFVFVPFDLNDLPITVNGGIIAHEFFHSIFYKLIYEVIQKKNIPIAQKIHSQTTHNEMTDLENMTQQDLFNETYLRGLNEGLADYWAWSYTTDYDFLKWSLSAETGKRTLKKQPISYETTKDIENEITRANVNSDYPSQYLGRYIYEIGTGYARFLKTLTELISEENEISLEAAKREVALQLISYLKTLPIQINDLKKHESLKVNSLFLFFAQDAHGRKMKLKQCQHIRDYLAYDGDQFECQTELNFFKVVKK